jgi:hypothetical protein
MMTAQNATKQEAGRSGIATNEAAAVAAYKKQQEQRKPESGGMTESQSAMKTKPDCGEQSYVGAGKLKDKVVLITGGHSSQLQLFFSTHTYRHTQ